MKKLILLIFFLNLPRASHACAVCFGGADSALQNGFFWGIVVLGLLPFLLVGIFVATISRASKRKNSV